MTNNNRVISVDCSKLVSVTPGATFRQVHCFKGKNYE